MSMRLIPGALCVALALTACENAEEPSVEPATETEEVEVEQAPEPIAEAEEPAPAEEEAPTAETVPIAEDFAEEAAKQVTADNYKQQLAAMEKELAE